MEVKKEFEISLAQRNHKELLGRLKSIAEKPQADNGLKEAIESQSRLIEKFLVAISNQPKPEKPNVSVETNQDKVVGSLQEMARQINDNLIELKKCFDTKPKKFVHKVTRNHQGFINEIISEAK